MHKSNLLQKLCNPHQIIVRSIQETIDTRCGKCGKSFRTTLTRFSSYEPLLRSNFAQNTVEHQRQKKTQNDNRQQQRKCWTKMNLFLNFIKITFMRQWTPAKIRMNGDHHLVTKQIVWIYKKKKSREPCRKCAGVMKMRMHGCVMK